MTSCKVGFFNVGKGVNGKFGVLESFFHEEEFEILFLEETTKTDKKPGGNILYSNCLHKGPGGNQSGGVTVWINENLQIKRRRDLEPTRCDGRIDAIFLELQRVGEKNVILGGVYINPADKFINPIKYLTKTVEKILNEDKEIVLGGDWNAKIKELGNPETSRKGKKKSAKLRN